MLPRSAPEQPELFEAVSPISTGSCFWGRRTAVTRVLRFLSCQRVAAGILGELVTAGLGVNGWDGRTSPACTEVETVILAGSSNCSACLPGSARSPGVAA